MVTLVKKLFIFSVFMLLSQGYSYAAITLPWSTTFNYAECTQRGGGGRTDCASVQNDGVYWSWGGSALGGNYTQVAKAANNPFGGGGNGFRSWVGDGSNSLSSPVRIDFPSPQREIWIRWYERWEQGAKWSSLSYNKSLYLRDAGSTKNPYVGFVGSNGYRIYNQGSVGEYPHSSSGGWETVYPGGVSDGSWHCYEVHMKMDTNGTDGIGQIWVDGKLVSSLTNVNYSNGSTAARSGWAWFDFQNNQATPANGRIIYVDTDDMSVYNTTPPNRDAQGNPFIGPISGASTPAPTNSAPVLASIGSKTVAENSSLVFSVSASDSNGDSLTYSASGLPSGATFSASSRTFSWTPNNTQAGSYNVTFTVSDGKATDSETVKITVTDVATAPTNSAPVLAAIGSKTVAENSSLVFSVSASDSNGDSLTYSASGLPSGATFSASSRTFSWTPNNTQAGSYNVTFTVSDGKATDSETVKITVTDTPAVTPPTAPEPTTPGTVLFEEKFESTNFSGNGWYDNVSPVLSSAQAVSGSTKSLECRFAAGATKPVNGGAMRRKFSDTDGVYVSYYVKYSTNWTGSDKPYHPHQFYLLTNKDSDWSGLSFNALTAYIEENEGFPQIQIQDGVNIDQNRLNQNLTGITEARSVAGCNGDSDGYGNGQCYNSGNGTYWNGKVWRAGKQYFTNSSGANYKGDWHKVEVYLKLNSISNGKAVKDGIIQYWFDGEPVLNYTDVVFRTGKNSDMKFNKLVIAPWIGDGSPVDQTFWVDNLVVATAPPESDSPAPPKSLRIVNVQ